MSNEGSVEYHSQRALEELNLGLVAQSISAARAHLQLSSMHMEKARALQGTGRTIKPLLAGQ